MADVKQAYGTEQTLTVTNLHSLASSPTAGWQSAAVDNATTDKFLDVLIYFVIDFANTAPANSKGIYVFLYSGIGAIYTNPASGSEGTITLPDVTANPLSLRNLGFIPYVTQDEIVETPHFSVAQAFGSMPQKWGVVLMNHSGAALAASGNTAKYHGVYATST